MEAKGKALAINQFNLAVVQTGFMGLATVAPDKLGLILTEAQLSDYVFFWRCVGRQLGIEDQYNLCGGGKLVSDKIVNEVTTQMLLPAAAKPPPEFAKMSQAYIDALNSVWGGLPLLSVPSTLAVTYWALGKDDEFPGTLTLLDSARFLNYRILFLLVGYCPLFEKAASELLLLVFKLRPPPPPPSTCPFTGHPAVSSQAMRRICL